MSLPRLPGLLALLLSAGAGLADEAFFERAIRPLLADTCFRCHGGERVGGKLRVDSRAALLKGGESGPAIVPGKPDASLLVRAIRHADDVSAMPPSKKLPAKAIADLETWVRQGAPWPAAAGKPPAFVHQTHWAFRPVGAVVPPDLPDVPGNAIDRFLAAAQRARQLSPVGPADRRTLIRRLTFDLTGLPPTPDEVEAFVADTRKDAYARRVEQLLASPAYGERWGRHWLDVVRYADTAGETADFPLPHAWRYRNYVVGAVNADRPYDAFLREQLAGDLLAARLPADAPADRHAELTVATGYLAIARRFGFDILHDHYLTIEDTIDVLGKSVLGLTVGCARCHDHKYDPVSTTDYYALYGIFESTRYPFSGCEKDKRPRDLVPLVPPAEAARRAKEIARLDEQVRAAEQAMAQARKALADAAKPPAPLASGAIPNGGAQEFAAGKGADALRAIPVRKGEMVRLTVLPKANHGADSTLVELEIAERGGRVWNLTADVLPDFHAAGRGCQHADRYGNRGVWHYLDVAGPPALLGRFVRGPHGVPPLLVWQGGGDTPAVFANPSDRPLAFVTVKLPPRSLAVHPGPAGGVAVAWQSPIDGEVTVRGRVQDADPTGGDGIAWTIDRGPGLGGALTAIREAEEKRDAARAARAQVGGEDRVAYAVAEGQPHDAQRHIRGDPERRGESVRRGSLQMLGGQTVPEKAGSGRLELAGWLADANNPLTARVIVNRVWGWHFGQGLVKTPSDFGTRGLPPSHPELLDWLAARFVADGWSLKALHRLIVHSAAYQRASDVDERNVTTDPDNTYLWRFSRRRLSGEEIRDAMLAVCGDLDRSPGGAHPFPPEGGWGFTQHGPFAAVYDHDRRSVYLMVQRIKRHPFLGLFDGADASSSTPARHTTTVPTQALFFLNDPFVHARAARLADALARLPDDPARVDRVCRLLFGRPATAGDVSGAARFLAAYAGDVPDPAERRRQAWSAYARVLLASNELLHVD